jgi:hypothetical protein
MTSDTDRSAGSAGAHPSSSEPVAGDPLLAGPAPDAGTAGPPIAPPPVATPAAKGSASEKAPQPVEADDPGAGSSKVKTAAVVAGAAAVANKVRHEAPKILNQLRERRVTGRRVIITEVDGRFLAIGPYKDAEAARQDAFRVGGSPHIAELVPDSAFFAPSVEE